MNKWTIFFTLISVIHLTLASEQNDFNKQPWGIQKEKVTPLKDYTLFNTSVGSILDKNALVKLGAVSFEKMLVFSPGIGLSQVRYEQSVIPLQVDVYCNNSLAYIQKTIGQEDHKTIRNNHSSRYIWKSSKDNTIELVCNKQGSIVILVLPKWLELQCTLYPKDISQKQTESKLSLYVDTWNNRILVFSGQRIADFTDADVKNDTFELSIPTGKTLSVASINRRTGALSGKMNSSAGGLVDVIGNCKISNNVKPFVKNK